MSDKIIDDSTPIGNLSVSDIVEVLKKRCLSCVIGYVRIEDGGEYVERFSCHGPLTCRIGIGQLLARDTLDSCATFYADEEDEASDE